MRGLLALVALFFFLPSPVQARPRPRPRPDDDDDHDADDHDEPHADETEPDPELDPEVELPPPPVPPWDERPLWPLPGISPEGRPKPGGKFGTGRGYSKKHPEWGRKLHPGVDLGAPRGTPIVAPEHGMVVATQGWDGPTAKALMFQTSRADGPALLIGAIEPGSAFTKGIFVARGTVIATVGLYPHGQSMLHIEAYERGTKQNHRWWTNLPRPSQLLDITPYVETMVQADGS